LRRADAGPHVPRAAGVGGAVSNAVQSQHCGHVRPANGTIGRWQISTEGGIDPRWALPDEIAYLQGRRIMAVSVKTAPAFSAGTPRLLVDRSASDFDLTRGGRNLLAEAPDPASPGRLNVVVSWFDELRRR
jgi:hypothetical protein